MIRQRFTITIEVETENDESISIIDIDEAAHECLKFEDFVVHHDRGKQADVGVIIGCVVDEVKDHGWPKVIS
jgi:hypothetical protein